MTTMKTKIKEYRAELNMKQIEKGQYNPSLKLAMDIAKVFQVPVEELFFFEDDASLLVNFIFFT